MIVQLQSFDTVVILCILVSSISLAMEAPGRTDVEMETFAKVDLVFMVAFTVEMVIKVIAHGFYWTHESHVVVVRPGEISYAYNLLWAKIYEKNADGDDEFDKSKKRIDECEEREVELVTVRAQIYLIHHLA